MKAPNQFKTQLMMTFLFLVSFSSLLNAQGNALIVNPIAWMATTWKGNVYGATLGSACENIRAAHEIETVTVSYHAPCSGYGMHTHSFTVTSSVSGRACLVDTEVHDCDGLSFMASSEPAQLVMFPVCPDGFYPDDGSNVCVSYNAVTDHPTAEDLPPDLGLPEDCPPANPINPANGNKFQIEEDYASANLSTLPITRTYNSLADTVSNEYQVVATVGARWKFGLDLRAIVHYSDVYDEENEQFSPVLTRATLIRGNGKRITFTLKRGLYDEIVWGNTLIGTSDPRETVEIVSGNSLIYRANNGDIETYQYVSSTGNLEWMSISSILHADGSTAVFTYDTNKRLTTVTQKPGAEYLINYDSSERISQISTPSGNIHYAYDSLNNLSSVTYPDSSIRSYIYDDENFPHALTGIIDENGIRYATFAYDNEERAILSKHANDTNLFTFSYGESYETEVTDPYGESITYQHAEVNGRPLRKSVSSLSTTCSSTAINKEFDSASGLVSAEYDADNNGTFYEYSNDSKTVNVTNTLGDQTTYDYLDAARLNSISTNRFIISFNYDSSLKLTSKDTTDLVTSNTKTITYSYDTNGRMSSINGPRTDVSDVTSFTYYSSGDLHTATNALLQTTTYSNYNGDGRVGRIVSPTGEITDITYYPRGWINTVTANGLSTDYDYDDVGNLIKITFPDASSTDFQYDEGHNLIQITDSQGNKLIYTLDNAGNRIASNLFSPTDELFFSQTQNFDNYGRLQQIVGSINQTTSFEYDGNGRRIGITEGVGTHITLSYDVIGRISGKSIDDLSINTYVDYNSTGSISNVTDYNGNQTVHYYDGLDKNTELVSPDTGTSSSLYDQASNLIEQTDASGITRTYTYDALNRITSVVSDGANAQSIAYIYDTCSNGIGRLCGVTDNSGSTNYTYTSFGKILNETKVIGGTTYVSTYTYDSLNRLLTTSLSNSGSQTRYSYDSDSKPIKLEVKIGSNWLTVLDATSNPGKETWSYGNSISHVTDFNLDGKVKKITSTGFTKTYSYDASNRITNINGGAAGNYTYYYDQANRLTKELLNNSSSNANSYEYSYDANGNRGSYKKGTTTTYYSVDGTSNRLLDTGSESISYDLNGNTIAKLNSSYVIQRDYEYDDFNRMKSYSNINGSFGNYEYDYRNLRVSKSSKVTTSPAEYTRYFYDHEGKLLGETTSNSTSIGITYLWFKGVCVGFVKGGLLYYVQNDHLGRPEVVYRRDSASVKTKVWQAKNLAFTRTVSTNTLGEFNIGFPGQYYDKESGLWYNWNRYYDANLGRYIESDPIGLEGGLNTYSYVNGNPLISVDPWGLSTVTFDRSDNQITFHPNPANGPLRAQTFTASNRPRHPDANPYLPEGNGPAPNGTFPVGNLIETGMGANDSFGSYFVPITLPREFPYRDARTGVGLHAGRANSPRGVGMAGTLGCVRSTEELGDYLRLDPLTSITIQE